MIFFLEENKTYTEKEIYMMHFLEKENAKLEYYTDKNFTTLWDYTVTAYTILYAKWVEHEHVYDQELIVYENAIYEQCECGHLSLALSLSSPTDLVYNGQEKKVIVNNNIDIAETDYSIAYYYQNQEGNWNPVDTYPIASGKYKAELTYNGMTIEQVYEITGKLNNPSTGDHVSMFLIITIISVIVLAIATYFLRKTLKNKKNRKF